MRGTRFLAALSVGTLLAGLLAGVAGGIFYAFVIILLLELPAPICTRLDRRENIGQIDRAL